MPSAHQMEESFIEDGDRGAASKATEEKDGASLCIAITTLLLAIPALVGS